MSTTTRIIDIDAMLPQDGTLKWRGREWQIPGDLPVQTIMRIQQLGQALQAAGDAGHEGAAMEALDSLGGEIASILATRQPDRAQDLAFGAYELGLLASAIVSLATGGKAVADPNVKAPARTSRQHRRK